MKSFRPIVSMLIVSMSLSLMGCSSNSESESTRALFDTREEAARAAKDFNCKGAHRMGDKWMPCESHDVNKKSEHHGKHGGHHNH